VSIVGQIRVYVQLPGPRVFGQSSADGQTRNSLEIQALPPRDEAPPVPSSQATTSGQDSAYANRGVAEVMADHYATERSRAKSTSGGISSCCTIL